jgi:hypothetical protein
MPDEANGTARSYRALWAAAAVAILVLLLWWAVRVYRARDAVPSGAPAGPTGAAPDSGATPFRPFFLNG